MGITSKNSNLTKAKAAKNDEFYTQYSDIEAELSHYEVKYFADRVVYLPCDDWRFSQFVKYFENNFTRLQLKALVATGINFNGAGYYYKKTSEGVITGELQGNGDFRSEACRQLMREADIIVTNPPFSLFREFVAQIMEFRKKFLILGNINAAGYRDIFPLLRSNEAWWGVSTNGSNRWMQIPDSYEVTHGKVENGRKYAFVNGVMWYTNLENSKRKEPLALTVTYDSVSFPKYDNYDAIEVSKATKIPNDYFGVMGVPITFLNKYCPEQFEILGMESSAGYDASIVGIPVLKAGDARPAIDGKTTYARIFIKRKTLPVEPEFLQSFVDGVERRS